MTLSIFLARYIGLYLIIVFLLLVTRKDEMITGIKACQGNQGLIMLSGVISLLGGLAILIGHPVWVWEWPLAITLLGLVMVVKGVIRLGYPNAAINCGHAILRNKHWWSWCQIITLVIGIFLTAVGFMN